MVNGKGTTRRWLLGAVVALTVVGGFAAAGAGGAKPAEPPMAAGGMHAILDSSIVSNRFWVEDINGPNDMIDVESWSWGATMEGGAGGGGGGGAGKASFQELHLTMRLSQYSPEFLEHLVLGKHIKKVVFEDYSQAQKKGNETLYLRITLEDCLISSFQTGGSSGDANLPMESLSINFAKITFTYNPRGDKDLGTGSPASFGYDLKAGKEV